MATSIGDRQSVRGSDAAIYYVEGGKRRWVPDAATFASMDLDWGNIQSIDDEELGEIPEGAPITSVIAAPKLDDGTLVSNGSEVFLTEGGLLRAIPDQWTFSELGGAERPVRVISQPEIDAHPKGEPVATSQRTLVVDLYTFLGAGHHMSTKAGLVTARNELEANTRTRTQTWFGGFHGGVEIAVNDVHGFIIWKSRTQRFGVDGTAIGRSDRTDLWRVAVPTEVVDQAASLTLFHFWSPNWMQNLNTWVTVGKKVAEVIGSVTGALGQKVGAGTGPVNKP